MRKVSLGNFAFETKKKKQIFGFAKSEFDREIKTKKVNFDGGTFRLFRGNILVVYIYKG